MKNLTFTFIVLPLYLFAQVNDANMWFSISQEKKLHKKWKLGLNQELRLYNNYQEVHSLLSEVSIQRKINSFMMGEVTYRYTLRYPKSELMEDFHRLFTDLNANFKYKKFKFSNRARLQATFGDVVKVYFRNRIKAQKKIKKWTPSIGYEFFLPLNNPRLKYINNVRYFSEIVYHINKKQKTSLSFIYEAERNVPNPLYNYILALNYTFIL